MLAFFYKHIDFLWKLNAFKHEVPLFAAASEKRELLKFTSLEQILDKNESSSLIPSVCEEVAAHMVSTSCIKYFDAGKMETSAEWIMKSLLQFG